MVNEINGNCPVLKWKRPDSVDNPKVWYTFKARDIDSDSLVEYRIQDLPLDRTDDLIDHLLESFISYEPTRHAMGFQDDPHAIEDYKQYIKPIIAQRTVLVCFKEDLDEIVGANMLCINTKDDTYFLDIRKSLKGSVEASKCELNGILSQSYNPFEKFKVDKYMSSIALSVDQKYRGRNIGIHFLNTRPILCREFGIKVILTIFTSDYSNVCADKAGYNIDMALSFTEIAEKYPKYEKIANTKSKRLTMRSFVV